MEHEALRVESVCTKIYVKVQKKIICGFLIIIIYCVSSQHNTIDQWPHIESYRYFATISFNTTFIH